MMSSIESYNMARTLAIVANERQDETGIRTYWKLPTFVPSWKLYALPCTFLVVPWKCFNGCLCDFVAIPLDVYAGFHGIFMGSNG